MSSSFEQPIYDGAAALRDAIAKDDPAVLAPMIIGAALYEEDFDVVYPACVRLSSHGDEIVRGNAVLGFGHLARLFGRLGDEGPEIVRRSLEDSSSYVRGQGHAAASDLEHFLGLQIRQRKE